MDFSTPAVPLPQLRQTLDCPICRAPVHREQISTFDQQTIPCSVCQTTLTPLILPRFFHRIKPELYDSSVELGEASCTFFPELQATAVCDECGAFLSNKARTYWGERELCLPCVYRLREKELDSGSVASRWFYDRIALALVTLGAPLSLFTTPIALFLLIRYRNTQGGFAPHSRTIWWIALILSLCWVVVWGILISILSSLILESVL